MPANNLEIVTSELTLLETLVQPVKQSNQKLAAIYETVLNTSAIVLFPITKDILRLSAEFRANQNFKTPDAIHCATASVSDCKYFVTNDIGFKRFTNIEVIVLKEIV